MKSTKPSARAAGAEVEKASKKQAAKPKSSTEKTEKDNTPKEDNKSQDLEPMEKDPRFEFFYRDSTVEHDGIGYLRVCVKGQKGRSPIACLLCRPDDTAKWVQKTQVVIKPPQILKMDACAILKFVSSLWMDDVVEECDLKRFKEDLVRKHLDGRLLETMQELWPEGLV